MGVGGGGVRGGAAAQCARSAVRRVRGLPLVPRDGPRELRGRRARRVPQRAVRRGQGRPGGTAGRRRRLHGGRAGRHRAGRVADDGLPHARQGAVLLRHLLPAGAPARHAVLPPGAGGRGRGLAGPATGGRGGRRADPRRPRRTGRGLLRRRPQPARRGRPAPGAGDAQPGVRPGPRWLRRRAQVPAGHGDRVPAAPPRAHRLPGGAGDGRPHRRRDGPRRHPRPARRRLRPVLGGRRLGRAALREDALRQRPAAARLPAPVADHRVRARTAGRAVDGGLPAARTPHPRRRVRLRAGRRQPGRGDRAVHRGRVLRVGARPVGRPARPRRRGHRRPAVLGHGGRDVRARHLRPPTPRRAR